MTRSQIMENYPLGHEEWVSEILDQIESRVNSAETLLKDIQDVTTLINVEVCLGELKSLSNDLY